jgi:hypothetical protein
LRQDRVEIVPVETRAQWRAFHRLPYRIYRDDPNWVAPLLVERRMHFSKQHNPYFRHAEASFWLALRDGEPVGRISAQIDQLHLETHKDATGHFGCLEAIDDEAVFATLLETAEDWLRARGLARAVGPLSFSLWHEAGLLVDGFEHPPFVMMGHARPYYSRHVGAAGYRGLQDLLAYSCNTSLTLPPAIQRIVDRSRTHWGVSVRPMRMDKRRFASEVAAVLDILNDAWSGNWGFVPMTEAEIDDFARLLKLLLKPGDVSIAEYQGAPAAFSVTFPNLNEAIRDLGGRLAPFGWAKLLWRLKVSGLSTARMPLMGVKKSYQDSNIGAGLALATIDSAIRANMARGVRRGELSWILQQNERVRHIIEWLGATMYKRYRLYENTL